MKIETGSGSTIVGTLESAGVEWDEIQPGDPGSSPETPFGAPPEDWDDDGVPYGAWCLCSECKIVERSTFAFDFFRSSRDSSLLVCENCALKEVLNRAKRP